MTETTEEEEPRAIKIYFDPWQFTIEENNEFLAKGYEPIPMRIPNE